MTLVSQEKYVTVLLAFVVAQSVQNYGNCVGRLLIGQIHGGSQMTMVGPNVVKVCERLQVGERYMDANYVLATAPEWLHLKCMKDNGPHFASVITLRFKCKDGDCDWWYSSQYLNYFVVISSRRYVLTT